MKREDEGFLYPNNNFECYYLGIKYKKVVINDSMIVQSKSRPQLNQIIKV